MSISNVELLPLQYSVTDGLRSPENVKVRFLPRGNLFQSLAEALVASTAEIEPVLTNQGSLLPFVAVLIGSTLALTFRRDAMRPSVVQAFVAFLLRLQAEIPSGGVSASPVLTPTVLDVDRELTFWAEADAVNLELLHTLWADLGAIRPLKDVEVATVPKLYGNKTRLVEFLGAILAANFEEGTPLLDLMSGTGVVSRALASRYPVAGNDANSYAATLTRAQGYELEPSLALDVLERIGKSYEQNAAELRTLVQPALDLEAEFLHAELTLDELCRYSDFCESEVLPIVRYTRNHWPYQLCTARYANYYFGVAQCIEIDSVRAAIDAVTLPGSELRELCLAALLIAASACNSGPHFAQPPRLKSRKTSELKSVRMFRDLAERRARSVRWEFELALSRLADRPRTRYPVGPVTQLDWPAALAEFVLNIGSERRGVVYLDPPYSKLQYSRYYHVLNSILSYDYPPVEGAGRTPPREMRFSSKFEYQPVTARKEFDALFKACAMNRLSIVASYSDTGFVTIDELLRMMAAYYGRADVFAERMRHHSQGVRLNGRQGNVTEYVLVARCS